MKIAVCGKTISGLTLSRLLATKNELVSSVDLFTALNDSARSIHRPHPLCEYAALDFCIQEDKKSSRTDCVKSIIEDWLKKGLIVDSNVAHCVMDHNGKMTRLQDTDNAKFYQPQSGGMFNMIDSLTKDLPGSVAIYNKQLVGMTKRNDQWYLQSLHHDEQGPYDMVLLAYDAMPRVNRKASFKQLLESSLPSSSTILASLAHSVSASAMTFVANFDPPICIPQGNDADCIRFENHESLAFATRNSLADAGHRGLFPQSSSSSPSRTNMVADIWTIVAHPEWSHKMRKGHGGKWDKKRVGQDLVRAFLKSVRLADQNSGANTSYKAVTPTFHWQGASLLTQVAAGDDQKAYVLDTQVGLGFCGDVLGGQGVQGALQSATDLVQGLNATNVQSYAPTRWEYRQAKSFDCDTNCLVGKFHGRDDPQDGLDHTWPTAVRIANGEKVTQADSLQKYRNRQKGNKNKQIHDGNSNKRAVAKKRRARTNE